MPWIIGKNVYLREYLASDLQAINDWRKQPEITNCTAAYVWPESLEETQAFLEAQLKNTDPANRKFAICLRENDQYIGHIGYEKLDLRRHNTELGIVIGYPELLSKGHGTEAIMLFLKVCFEDLGLHRVGLGVFVSNERGRRCYEKCGFQEEGILREWHFAQGQWKDIMLMSILEDEYREMMSSRAG